VFRRLFQARTAVRLSERETQQHNESQCERNTGTFQADANPVIGLAQEGDIARKFSQQAAKLLSQEEFTQLLKFVESPKAVFNGDLQQLQPKVTAALEEFYSNETAISDHDREGLGRTGRPSDADIGVVLHPETKDLGYLEVL
jgi:hypothetical protein